MESVVDIVIIGAGLAGISACLNLSKELGTRAKIAIYEKAGNLGGVWRDNVYPGCASDTFAQMFSHSSHLSPTWSRMSAPQSEILAYLNRIANHFDLRSRIHFNSELIAGKWDSSTNTYSLSVRDTITGEVRFSTCHILICATGSLSRPRMLDVPGVDVFKGTILRSTEWDTKIDLRNKRVALIGNGASAAQILPSIAATESIQLTQFFKVPNWYVGGKYLVAPISARAQELCRKYPILMELIRVLLPLNDDGYSQAEIIYLTVYGVDILRPLIMELVRNYMLKSAPEIYHDILTPNYPLGSSRILFDVGYFQSLHLNSVKLLRESVVRLTETGVVTSGDRLLDFDVIIAATGFDTSKAPLAVSGRSGQSLQEYYDTKGGPEAYRTVLVPDFPNFFVLGGPNGALSHFSYWFTIECQVGYLQHFVRRLASTELVSFEVTQTASDAYNCELRKRFQTTVYNIFAARYLQSADTGKHIIIFPGCATLYWWWHRSPKWEHFLLDGKVVVPSRMTKATPIIFAALLLAITLAVVLYILDRGRG